MIVETPDTPGRRTIRVLAIANPRGGVAETATAINLGTTLASTGERVLIVAQGNASSGLGLGLGTGASRSLRAA
jgi:chromosome partitioning protein